MDTSEVKSLRWLANMFPLQLPARDENDKICNAIHLYCTAGADKIEAQALRIEELDVELQEANETIDNLRDEIRDIRNGRYQLAEKIKDAVDRIFDGEFEEEAP